MIHNHNIYFVFSILTLAIVAPFGEIFIIVEIFVTYLIFIY